MPTHTAEIIIDASTERVFESLTNPELIKLWQYGRVVTTDWNVGGDIHFKSELAGSTEALEEWGTILDIRPNELIKYRLFTQRANLDDSIENDCITSYVVSNDGGNSRVRIIQEDNRPTGFSPRTLTPILAALKRVAEIT